MRFRVHFTATDKGYVTVTAKDKDQAFERAKEKFNDGRFIEYLYNRWEITDIEELKDEE